MPNTRRRLEGRVVSNKMEKTVVVAIERRKMHPIYKKVVRTTKKIMAHDESNELEIGALVRVVESRPLSRRKRWVVEAVIRADSVPVLETLPDEEGLIGGAPEAEDETEIEAEAEAEIAAEAEVEEVEAEDAEDAEDPEGDEEK